MSNPQQSDSARAGGPSLAVMRVIELRRRPLLMAGVVFLVLFALELIYLHGHAATHDGRMRTLALTLPPLGALLCLLPLCYLTWFREPQPHRLRRIKLALFWLLAVGAVMIWGNVVWLSLGLQI